MKYHKAYRYYQIVRLENDCSFLNALHELRENNLQVIDIVELNIVFLESTIIIHKIFENSISSQLKKLIDELYSNHMFFTKGLTHIPFEIHIPVFEERSYRWGVNHDRSIKQKSHYLNNGFFVSILS